ncbi:hypothetical protein PCC7424_0446 [Gloeothece citriformis PCC 7424]|uniref:Uncharacterized protein n=1 Tax=Gloeothece citriformis (strain PCC 7424) TaxID=65393 RepID=B7KD92_GLOC7|nr:hypothetical protein PCC7424_0446 [Gloeothece citriformis PCC 7424]
MFKYMRGQRFPAFAWHGAYKGARRPRPTAPWELR